MEGKNSSLNFRMEVTNQPAPCSNICFSSYLHSLSQTPQRLRKRLLATWTPDQELNQMRLRSGADMKRKLLWYDLVALGVGGMLGVGVFVTTGRVARSFSGPSVFISYIIAGISALLSSLCYTEFSVQIPVAGGAFSYLRVTFGEFVGYFAGANILMEYVLSNAAVARSFTEYLCCAFGGSNPDSWRIEVDGMVKGYNMLDFPAVAITIFLTLCLCHSTKESSILNLVMTVFHVGFFGFIIITGFCNGSAENLVKPGGLAPFGVRGVLDGAAIVYFSYIGYDSVSTMAEEIKNPSKSLPIGIVGSVLVVSALYCLMGLSLCLIVPYDEVSNLISVKSNIRDRFIFDCVPKDGLEMGEQCRWGRCKHGNCGFSPGCHAWPSQVSLCYWKGPTCAVLVSQGASFNRHPLECNSLLGWVASSGNSVIFTFLCTSETLSPEVLFKQGVCQASIALFTELDIVIEMISIGTLLVFYLVANALIYRRYVITSNNPSWYTIPFLILLSCSSMAFSLSWKFKQQWWGLPVFGSSVILITAFFHYKVPCSRQSAEWSVPFMPWPAALSIFLNVFLMTTLSKLSYQRFGIWSCLITLFYVLYGVHSTYQAESMEIGVGAAGHPDSSNRKIDIQ
ncbi:hypothetical protein RJ639_043343, partial [Escallonia herrerae]